MIADYGAEYQPPAWFNYREARGHLQSVTRLLLGDAKRSAYRVAGSLGTLERLDRLPQTDIAAFEFGSGFGEGLVALDMLVRSRGEAGSVIGSEKDKDRSKVAKRVAQTLTRVTRVDHDGLETLAGAPDSFDLILANMFGPSRYNSVMVANFVPPATRALRAGGVILMNSDDDTMRQVRRWTRTNLPSDQVEVIDWRSGVLPPGLSATTHVVIGK